MTTRPYPEQLATGTPEDGYVIKFVGGEIRWSEDNSGSDIWGPGSSTDNALVRWDGTDGTTLKNSVGALNDLGGLSLGADGYIEIGSGVSVVGDVRLNNGGYVSGIANGGIELVGELIQININSNTQFEFNDGYFSVLGEREVRLYGSDSHYSGFKASATGTTNVWTLPEDDGPDGYVLTTDGSNTLYWSIGGGSGGGETLEQTLALGNTTGSNWILVDDTYGIDSSAAGGSLRILAGGGTTGMMLISCGSNPAGSGGAMILESGDSSSGDSGGAINILAGSSTDIGLGGLGGQIVMSAGNGDLTGGGISIGAGQGGTNGGNLSILSGEGITGNGGALSITAGNGYLVGADLTISAGDSATGGGGVATLQSGDGYTGGGHAFVYAGDAEYNNGGMLQIRSGSSTYNGGGAINVMAGQGETGGGTIYVTAGNCNTGNSGNLYLSAGGSTTIPYANNGGNIYLTAGSGAVGGFVSISAGFDNGGYYGDVLIRGDSVNIDTIGSSAEFKFNDGYFAALGEREIRLYGFDDHYSGFKASATGTNNTWTLPEEDGPDGYVLTTNGSGTLYWSAGGGTQITFDITTVDGYGTLVVPVSVTDSPVMFEEFAASLIIKVVAYSQSSGIRVNEIVAVNRFWFIGSWNIISDYINLTVDGGSGYNVSVEQEISHTGAYFQLEFSAEDFLAQGEIRLSGYVQVITADYPV